MKREQLKKLIRKYHQMSEYELQQILRNPRNELCEQISTLDIQDVRLDILCDQITKYFKNKGFKKVSFMVEPNCFALVLKDAKLKTICYPVFDYSAIDDKKVKVKKDFYKANIDFVKLISNYDMTGFSLFLTRFPECEDVMLNALKLTNHSRYERELNGSIEEQASVNKILTQPQDISLINKMIKREKYLATKIEKIKHTLSNDENEIELKM